MDKIVLRCYLVDYDVEYRHKIASLIDKHPNLNLIQQYGSCSELNSAIKNSEVDLIIADVDLSDGSVYDIVKTIEDTPIVMVVTDRKEEAFNAYEAGIVDFIGKPVDFNRFDQAIEKCKNAYFLQTELQKKRGDYIFVKCNLKKRKVYLNELNYVEALGDYVKLMTNDDSLVVLSTMKAFEKRLPEQRFFRIHKSYIVNLNKIERFNTKYVELVGKKLPVSRNKKSLLAELLSGIIS